MISLKSNEIFTLKKIPNISELVFFQNCAVSTDFWMIERRSVVNALRYYTRVDYTQLREVGTASWSHVQS